MAELVANEQNKVYFLDRRNASDETAGLFAKWEYYIGPAAPFVKDKIRQAMKDGLSVDDIVYAIEETAQAPRPSIRYFAAICTRLKTNPSREKVKPIANERSYSDREMMSLFDNLTEEDLKRYGTEGGLK